MKKRSKKDLSIVVFVIIILFIIISIIALKAKPSDYSDQYFTTNMDGTESSDGLTGFFGSDRDSHLLYDDTEDVESVYNESTEDGYVSAYTPDDEDYYIDLVTDDTESVEEDLEYTSNDEEVTDDSDIDEDFGLDSVDLSTDDYYIAYVTRQILLDSLDDYSTDLVDTDYLSSIDRNKKPFSIFKNSTDDDVVSCTGIASSGTVTIKLDNGNSYRFRVTVRDNKITNIKQS